MASSTGAASHNLVCHPQTATRAIQGIRATVEQAEQGRLGVTFTLAGRLRDLRIPEPRAARLADGLWRHTCFEVFVMADDGPGYHEYNFSPSGEWAACAFRGYRDGGDPDLEYDPGIAVHQNGGQLELAAAIRLDFLPPGRPLRLGLSAVVEEHDGTLSYWALRHPPGQPDFHHPAAFALQLEPAERVAGTEQPVEQDDELRN